MKITGYGKPLLLFATGVLALGALFMSALTAQASSQVDPTFRDPVRGFFLGAAADGYASSNDGYVSSADGALQPGSPLVDGSGDGYGAPPSRPVGAAVPDFDGQTLPIKNITDYSTACLEVKSGTAADGQDVRVASCDDSNAQQWKFEQRAAGDYKDAYRLVSQVGDGTYCLDNGGNFSATTSNSMSIRACVGDSAGTVANQSVTIAASGEGYTLTFTSGGKSVWLLAFRSTAFSFGETRLTAVADTAPWRAVWSIVIPSSATPTATAEPTPTPTPADFDGKTVSIRNVTSASTACLGIPYVTLSDGQSVRTEVCDDSDNGQQWQFEKRAAGDYKDAYRLVNQAGDGAYCLDNAGEFTTRDRMTISSCVSDTHDQAANQSVTLAVSGDGYTLTFTRNSDSKNSDSKSVWLTTLRPTDSASGSVSQNTVAGTPPWNAVWGLSVYTPPATPEPTPTPAPTPTPTPTPAPAPADFDGMTVAVQHVTGDSTACLEVKSGTASNGQDVQTAACNDSKAQQWQVEKRTAGDYKGSYRLVSQVGGGYHCLDNRGDFTTSQRMGIWACVKDNHWAAANQSVAIAASGDGYTLTFNRNSDSKSVWLVTDRASATPSGGANQTTVSGAAPAAAIWSIVSESQPAFPQLPALVIGTDDPPPDPFDGKTLKIKHVRAESMGCLGVLRNLTPVNGRDLETYDCGFNDARQQWKFEKISGVNDTYRLVSQVSGNFCLDNRGDYETSERVSLWTCLAATHADAPNQQVTIGKVKIADDADGEYYTLTFARSGKSSWLSAERPYGRFWGNAEQTTVRTGDVPVEALWWIGDDAPPTPLPVFPAPDTSDPWDGKIVELQHVTSESTACLEVDGGTVGNGHPLRVWACNDTNAQKWRIHKRTHGQYAASSEDATRKQYYSLGNMVGNGRYCMDNRAFYGTTDRMGIWSCLGDTHYGVANQSVIIEASGDGYTITFRRLTGNTVEARSWLTTDRASDSPYGDAGQTGAPRQDTGSPGAAGVWRIVTD